MISLYGFQTTASDTISERVLAYFDEPVMIGTGTQIRKVSFIQLLSSLTASGKTIILADAVASIARQLPIKPVVLWLSKATVVVEQTYANLDAGGALHALISEFLVRPLADYDQSEVADASNPFLYFATVGTFNQKDKEKGGRLVFKSALDTATTSTWESLKLRPDGDKKRRPLIVVYDEAHNLSDQQTDLLLELEPDAFLLSTATQRIPRRFNEELIDVLKKFGKRTDNDLITHVDAKAVANSGMIKTTIELVGRQAPMEDVIAEMLEEIQQTESDGATLGLQEPKAVYVCKTNVVEGSDERDSPKQPFAQRAAPPILIWRHLTEKLGVDPASIAVYADLKVDKNYPLPDDFVLFGGGDKDYDAFISGNYRHILFNQSLQEGWDDPLVYFAYIDKSMGSKAQAEQVVGRLLRQPGRKHYAADRLNTAQIHVRVESAGVFDEVVNSVQQKIRNEQLDIKVIKTAPDTRKRKEFHPKKSFTIPVAAIITDEAEEPINKCIAKMTDFRHDDGTNTRGSGQVARVQKIVGEASNLSFVWENAGTSAVVLARWLFTKEVRKIYPNALGLALTSSGTGVPTKFDARIGLGSNAANYIASVAREVAKEFVDNVYLKLRKPNAFVVGPILQHERNVVAFQHAIHAGYADLNPDELKFAHGLDQTKLDWARNPPRTGYGIPLVEPGKTENFYPDFLVWKGKNVYAIDTKAAHLHNDAMRKLQKIRPADGKTPRVFVRFVTPGLVDEKGAKKDSSGYTVWSFKPNGALDFVHCERIDQAISRCLKPDV